MKPETAPRLEDARDALVVLVTCPDEPTAAAIARTVVEEGLAACVNVSGEIRSIYRWRGNVEEAGERLLLVKARADALEALARRILDLHPYEVPEILALPVALGHRPYLDWLLAHGG